MDDTTPATGRQVAGEAELAPRHGTADDPRMIEPEDIARRIETALPGARVEVRDLTGTRDHYALDVVSGGFVGLTSLQRHRAVHAALRDVLGGALHAIEIRARTPDEVHS